MASKPKKCTCCGKIRTLDDSQECHECWQRRRDADRIDGHDRDDLGESPDF